MDAKVTLVVGGGVSGIKAALKQAEAGNKVYLLESAPGLSGEVITSGNSVTLHSLLPGLIANS